MGVTIAKVAVEQDVRHFHNPETTTNRSQGVRIEDVTHLDGQERGVRPEYVKEFVPTSGLIDLEDIPIVLVC
jgi:hypothetical protein